MLRSIGAVLAGIVAAVIVIMLVESLGHFIFPTSQSVDPSDPESLKAAMENIPLGAMLAVLAAWAAGSLAGGWVAAMIATRSFVTHALIVGVVVLIFAIINMAMIPHPLWFWIVGVIIILPAAYVGGRLVGRQL